jgi:hypothetical protein
MSAEKQYFKRLGLHYTAIFRFSLRVVKMNHFAKEFELKQNESQTSLSFGEGQLPGDRREILDCLSYIMVYI